MEPKRWITFDLDGTLMQNPFGKWVFPEIKQLFAGWLQQEVNTTEALVNEHERRMSQNRTVEAYDWDDMVRLLLAEHKLDREIDVEKLVLQHSVVPKIHLLEDSIIPVLTQLKQRGFSLATVTNGFYKYQYPVMKELGIADLFDEIVTPEIAGCGKPDPKMMNALQQSGQIVAHVGDRIDHDVCTANLAGVPSVLIYRDLPERLREVSPELRPAQAEMLALCEEKLKSENQNLKITQLEKLYSPAFVIFRLEELLGCV
jgi:putative hydrolase of the HAD superfamily